MATQMSSARRGVATDEMKQVAKDEDVTLDWLLPKHASRSEERRGGKECIYRWAPDHAKKKRPQ